MTTDFPSFPSGVTLFYKGNAFGLFCSFLDATEPVWNEAELDTYAVAEGVAAFYSESQKKAYVFYLGIPSYQGHYVLYRAFNADTLEWEGEKEVTDTAASGVAAPVIFNGKIYCFHQGPDNANSLWFNAMDPDTGAWAGDQQLRPSNINGSPSAVVFQDELYCFHRAASTDELIYKVYNGQEWTGQKAVPGTHTAPEPSAVVFDGKLFCFHEGSESDGTLRYNVFDGRSWLEQDKQVPLPTGWSVKGQCAVARGASHLFCFYRKDDEAWYSILDASDMSSWSSPQQVSRTSSAKISNKLGACNLPAAARPNLA